MLFDLVLIVVLMHNDLVPEVEQGCLVAYALLDVHIQRLHMQIIKPENRTEVGNDLRDADDDIGALLTCQVVEFEVYLQTFWLLRIIRLL